MTDLAPLTLPDRAPDALVDALPAGHVCLLGGPGSGRSALLDTVALTHAGTPGRGALLLLPSRRAAAAASDRILTAHRGPAVTGLSALTWGAFTRSLLETEGETPPRLLGSAEQRALVQLLLSESDPDDWGSLAPLLTTRPLATELTELFDGCRQRMVGPAGLAARGRTAGRPAWVAAAGVLARYEARLDAAGLVDQVSLPERLARSLGTDPRRLAALVRRHPVVLVDDAHRLDPSRVTLLARLAAGGARILLAGDPIGPGAGLLLPGILGRAVRALQATPVLLPASRRLGGSALDAVRRLRTLDPDAGPGRTLLARPAAGASGHTALAVHRAGSATEEAETAARVLLRAHREHGLPTARMAVLLATPVLRGLVEQALTRHGLPVRSQPVLRRHAQEPVARAVLDLLRAVRDPDATDLLPGLLTGPLVGLDQGGLRALRRAAVTSGVSLAELVVDPAARARVPAGQLPARAARRAALLGALLDRTNTWSDHPPDRCLRLLWLGVPALRRLARAAGASLPGMPSVRVQPVTAGDRWSSRQLDAVTALARSAARLVDDQPAATTADWLDAVERGTAPAGDQPPVRAAAVHVLDLDETPGLDLDVVVVVGCLDSVLPGVTPPEGALEAWRLDGELDPIDHARAAVAAARRRLADAIGRARHLAVLTFAPIEGRGEPSRFLTELGLDPSPPPAPLTHADAVSRLRRLLVEPGVPRPQRLAAARTLAGLPGVDPQRWWWSRDWTQDPDPIAPGGRLRTSFSRIGSYEDCHLRYFYGSVLGLDDGPVYRMEFGKLMHTIFELAAENRIDPAPDALKAAFRERFDSSWFPSRAVAHQFWRDGLAMLRTWYEGESELARNAVALEVAFSFQLGRHTVRGRIDRVDAADPPAAPDQPGIALLDYKTARSIPSKQDVEGSLQLAIYHLAALRDPSLRRLGAPVELQLVFPAEERDGRFRRVGHRPPPGWEADVERRLLPLLDGAASEDFTPSPHADCRFCDFKPLCPLWPQGQELLGATAPETTT